MERPLLYRIERFLVKADMPPTLFGRRSVCDPRLVSDLRNGREPGPKMIARVEHFMNNYRVHHNQNRRGVTD